MRIRLRQPAVAVLAGADIELLDVMKADLMEEAHFHVVTATAPELVVPLIERTTPGVVIMDMSLPEQSSWDILAALRQRSRFRTLPVILLSASPEDAERVAVNSDSWVELVLKPFDLDAVYQRIQYLAQQQKSDAEKGEQKSVDTSLPTSSSLLLLGDTGN
jgi:DNA-binding response OmpR family regulator